MPTHKPVIIARPGKTERDRISGAAKRRAANHTARADWNRTINERGSRRPPFPIETCNGRDTRALRSASKRMKKVKGTGGGIIGCKA